MAIAVVFSGCDKTKEYDLITPPSQGNFVNQTIATYYVTNSTADVYKIPVGVTTVSDKARTINFSLSTSTGATAGTQYSLVNSSVTVPAGKAIDSIRVHGIFAGYTTTRVDTLTFTITGGDVAPSDYNRTFKLVVRQACPVVASDLSGAFAHSTDFYNGAASAQPNYTATISAFTSTSATTATINIKNLGATSDNGWGPFAATDAVIATGLTATLDWTNPANQTVVIPLQNYFGTTASQSTIVASGTFSSCDNTYTIVCDVKYAPNGLTYRHTSLLRR